MARVIRGLPDHLVEQLATGEVVERPASAVKELVENALDAGAAHITVSIRNGGKAEVRVADDGHGLSRDQALLALEPYSTSKLDEGRDFGSVRTLGFRGAALPAIAAVSRMQLETAERDGEGTRLVVNGGNLVLVESCERRVGTTVVVRSLFYNAPERAKSLRPTAAEARAVRDSVVAIALGFPTVAFDLLANARELLRLPQAPDLRTRVADLWGEAFAAGLLPVAHRMRGGALTGLVQDPGRAQPGTRHHHIFVNGRPVSDRRLMRAAGRALQEASPPDSRPSLFLFLDLADSDVDLNVHPAKAEVRLRDSAAVEELVSEGVRMALDAVGRSIVPGRREGSDSRDSGAVTAPRARLWPERSTTEAAEAARQMSLFVAGGETPGEPQPSVVVGRANGSGPTMWQVHDTYIFAETRGGLVILDQHSAHERVLFEEIVGGAEQYRPVTQRLLFPIALRLSPAEFARVEELCSLLVRIGFELELFGGRTVIVHSAPQPHPHFDAERCLRDMISELTGGSELVNSARSQHQRVALSFACKGAIRAGQPLTLEEMTELFDRLFATESPYHDIHGRPTIVQLTLTELYTRFGR